jgi:hypothetical protein
MTQNIPAAKTETELFERYAGPAFEKQMHFSNLVGKYNWGVDMKKGEISFGSEFHFPLQVIGSFSHDGGTWLWAWANTQSGLSEQVTEHAVALQQYGEENGIDFLTEPEFEYEKNKLQFIALLASGMFGCSGYYLANYGSGTLLATITSPAAETPAEEPANIIKVTQVLISNFEFNHREFFKNYLSAKGYKLDIDENQINAIGRNKITADFDNLGRLTNITFDSL